MTKFRMTRNEAGQVAEKTQDAYSSDRYRSWEACAIVLMDHGYDVREAEAILRSKHMRWAGDAAIHPDHPTSSDLVRYLKTPFAAKELALGSAKLKQLVDETFN